MTLLKRIINRLSPLATAALARFGYALRPTGGRRTLTGADLWHDVAVHLGHPTRPLMIDVGANKGQTTWAMLKAFPRAHVVAFEPSPRNLDLLRANYDQDHRVTIEPMAVGDAPGTATLHEDWYHCANDSLMRAPTWEVDDPRIREVDVDVCTIDGYRPDWERQIDVLKIDAQGFDLKVLQGARGRLQRRAIRLVTAEVNVAPLYTGQPSMADMLTFMDGIGYTLLGTYEPVYLDNRLLCLNLCWAAP